MKQNRLNILEHFVDLQNGLIPLIGEVGEEMYAHLVRSLMALNDLGVEHEQLTFILNTYGGDLYQALAIYDLIKMQPMKTVVQCNGPVMSAGTIILQAADVRLMTTRAYLMFHFGIQAADSSQCVAHYEELSKDMRDIYTSRSGISPKVVKSWFEKDTYYNAESALKNKLIDGIVPYDKKET